MVILSLLVVNIFISLSTSLETYNPDKVVNLSDVQIATICLDDNVDSSQQVNESLIIHFESHLKSDNFSNFGSVFKGKNFIPKINKVWSDSYDKSIYYASLMDDDEHLVMFSVPFGFSPYNKFWSSVRTGFISRCKNEFSIEHEIRQMKDEKNDNLIIVTPSSLSLVSSKTLAEDLPNRYSPSVPTFDVSNDLESIFLNDYGVDALSKYLKENTNNKNKITFKEYLHLYHRYPSTLLKYNAIAFVEDPPVSFDPRRTHPECFGLETIMDQGSCGSCWAVAISSAISHRTCMNGLSNFDTKTGRLHMMSPIGLTSCGKESKELGCNGGSTTAAMGFTVNNAFPSIDDVPYSAYTFTKTSPDIPNLNDCTEWILNDFKPWQLPPSCSQASQASDAFRSCRSRRYNSKLFDHQPSVKEFSVSSYYALPAMISEDSLLKWTKLELSTNGPIVFSIDYQKDEAGDGGIVQMIEGRYDSDKDSKYHSVVIIGYVGNEYFLIKNSWGGNTASDDSVHKVPMKVFINQFYTTQVMVMTTNEMTNSNLKSKTKDDIRYQFEGTQQMFRPSVSVNYKDKKVTLSYNSKNSMNVNLKLKDQGVNVRSSGILSSVKIQYQKFLSKSSPKLEVKKPNVAKDVDAHDLVYDVEITSSGPTATYTTFSDRLAFPMDGRDDCSTNAQLFAEFSHMVKSKSILNTQYMDSVNELLRSKLRQDSKPSCFVLPGLLSQYSIEDFNFNHFTSTMSLLGAVMYFTPHEVLHPRRVFNSLQELYDDDIFNDRSSVTAYFVALIRRFKFDDTLTIKSLYQYVSKDAKHLIPQTHAILDAMEFFTDLTSRRALVSVGMKISENSKIKATTLFHPHRIAKYGSDMELFTPDINAVIKKYVSAENIALLNPILCPGRSWSNGIQYHDIRALFDSAFMSEGNPKCLQDIIKRKNIIIIDSINSYLRDPDYYSALLWRYTANLFTSKIFDDLKFSFVHSDVHDLFMIRGIVINRWKEDNALFPKKRALDVDVPITLDDAKRVKSYSFVEKLLAPSFFRQGVFSTDSLLGMLNSRKDMTQVSKDMLLHNSLINPVRRSFLKAYFMEFDIDEVALNDRYQFSGIPVINHHVVEGIKFSQSSLYHAFDSYCMNQYFNDEAANAILDNDGLGMDHCLALAAHADLSAKHLNLVLKTISSKNRKYSIKTFSYISPINANAPKQKWETENFYPSAYTWLLLGGFDKTAMKGDLQSIVNSLEALVNGRDNIKNDRIKFINSLSPSKVLNQYRLYLSAVHPAMLDMHDYLKAGNDNIVENDNPEYFTFNDLSVALLRLSQISPSSASYKAYAEDVQVIFESPKIDSATKKTVFEYDDKKMLLKFGHITRHPFVFLRLKPSNLNVLEEGSASRMETNILYRFYLKKDTDEQLKKSALDLAKWFLPALMVGNIDMINFIVESINQSRALKILNCESSFDVIKIAIQSDTSQDSTLHFFFKTMQTNGLSFILSRADTFVNAPMLEEMTIMLRMVLNLSDLHLGMQKTSLGDDHLDVYIEDKTSQTEHKKNFSHFTGTQSFDILSSIAAAFYKNKELRTILHETLCNIYSSSLLKYSIEEQIPLTILSTFLSLNNNMLTHLFVCRDLIDLPNHIMRLPESYTDYDKTAIIHFVHPIMRRFAASLVQHPIFFKVATHNSINPTKLSASLYSITVDKEIVLRTRFHTMLTLDMYNEITKELLYSVSRIPMVRLLESSHSDLINSIFPIAKNKLSIEKMAPFVTISAKLSKFYDTFEKAYISNMKSKWSRVSIGRKVLKKASKKPKKMINLDLIRM